jgi:uncharacterized protein (TIGR03083 family)
MVPERDVDCAAMYESSRQEFLALMRSLNESQLATTVPATPLWSVRDILSHLVGINADLNRLNFGIRGDAEWTAAQVEPRRALPLEEVAAEWDHESVTFEEGLRVLGYAIGSHYIGDYLQHLADVLHALGRVAPTDEPRLSVALDFYLLSCDEELAERGVGSLDVSVGNESWTLGAGDTIAAVSGPRYELFRALGGRRSLDQIRALDWQGDVEQVLPMISRYPLPERPIVELM